MTTQEKPPAIDQAAPPGVDPVRAARAVAGKSSSAPLSGADGFRAIACLGVFCYHLFQDHAYRLARSAGWAGELLLAGGTGVAAFFVLSGFLLSMPFWRALRTGRSMPDLRIYAARRLARIVPGYVACFLIVGLLTNGLTGPDGRLQLLTSLTFTNSFLPGTFIPPFDGPLWSITIEVLFYVMLPFVALAMFRLRSLPRARAFIFLLIAVILAGQFLLVRSAGFLEAKINNPTLFLADSKLVLENALLLFTHFLMGVLAADVFLVFQTRPGKPGEEPSGSRWNRFDSVAVLFLFLIPLFLSGMPGHVPILWRVWSFPITPYHWPLLHLMLGVLLVSMALSLAMGRWLDVRFLRWTATLSFGIYMWHAPVIRCLNHWWPLVQDDGWYRVIGFGLTALAASYAVAALSYYVIEAPVLKWAHGRQWSRT